MFLARKERYLFHEETIQELEHLCNALTRVLEMKKDEMKKDRFYLFYHVL